MSQSSTELSERMRRRRRRERDDRAEKRALAIVAGGFVGLGVALWVGLSYWEPSLAEENQRAEGAEGAAAENGKAKNGEEQAAFTPPGPMRATSEFEESVDLPALRALRHEGLTIAAEGLPEILTTQQDPLIERWAAELNCRFAYGVWEFSPNRRFRFLSTCGALDGEVLVGAYQVKGTQIHLSELGIPGARLSTIFSVERPSRLKTQVFFASDGAAVTQLEVRQRVTVIRQGLEAEGFLRTFGPKNHLGLPGGGRSTGSVTRPPPAKDPLLDLLKGGVR